MSDAVLFVTDRREKKFLKKKTRIFDFSKFSREEASHLIVRMKKAMREAGGIGLSANQIGLDMKVFVAEVPSSKNEMKFYAIFNPEIEKFSEEKTSLEEGCLSVPHTYGSVERAERVLLRGQDKNGKPLKIKAWGLLARVFQHEFDHLHGILFTDRAKEVRTTPVSKRLKEKQ